MVFGPLLWTEIRPSSASNWTKNKLSLLVSFIFTFVLLFVALTNGFTMTL